VFVETYLGSLLLISILGLGHSLVSRKGGSEATFLFGALVVATGAALAYRWELLSAPLFAIGVGIAICASLVLERVEGSARELDMAPRLQGFRRAHLLLVVPVVIHFIFAYLRLGQIAGSLLTWEGEVLAGFSRWQQEGRTFFDILRSVLRWDDGLMSSGNHSLLYGAPTFLLLNEEGFSGFNLRIMALLALVLGALGICALLDYLGGWKAALVGVVFYLLSPIVNYYGVYGTSQMAAIAGCIWSYYFLFRIIDSSKPCFSEGAALGFCLCVTTLHYSPERIVVLGIALVAFGKFVTLFPRRQWRGFAGFVCVVAFFLAYQFQTGAYRSFAHARGEQLLTFLAERGQLKHFDNKLSDEQARALSPGEVVRTVLTVTSAQLGEIMRPVSVLEWEPNGMQEVGDPPRLPFVLLELLPFALAGLLLLDRKRLSWRRMALLAPVVMVLSVVLLTTRVDQHRLAILVVPFLVLAAVGVSYALARSTKVTLPLVMVLFVFTLVDWVGALTKLLRPLPLPLAARCALEPSRGSQAETSMYVQAPFPEWIFVDQTLKAEAKARPGTRLMERGDVAEVLSSSGPDFSKLQLQLESGRTINFIPRVYFSPLSEQLSSLGELDELPDDCGFVLKPPHL
jgi:hypothetical protein